MYGKAEVKLMDDIYKALYDYEGTSNYHDAERSSELACIFDENMETSDEFKELVNQFVKVRGDYISSDREAVAFMLMYAFV